MNILETFKDDFVQETTTYSISEFLELCPTNPDLYSTTAQRMLKAIGDPVDVDTSKDPRLSRIFSNRKIKQYPAFKDFHGMEEAIENIVSHFKHASQALEESKTILYLLGPVGGGKSSLAERLKKLLESQPIYVLGFIDDSSNIVHSPLFESPFGLFDREKYGQSFLENYNIPVHRLNRIPSPWAVKRLTEVNGDLERFCVIKMYPSRIKQIGITKTEPGDENNQDISALVGKVDIRNLEFFSQDDPDAYSYSGGLNIATQGLLDFVEMFKSPQKMLHPLLTATQEGNYNGTQGFGAMPFEGVIVAHSNESEWESFKNDKKNEAFLDRIHLVKVPYCLRVDDEIKIYEKLIENSELKKAMVAPGTLEMMAEFVILTRLVDPENSNIYSKMRVYNGENLKDKDPKAKTLTEYKRMAGPTEGMDGLSTRYAFKVLSKTFNYDSNEIAANPIHLMSVITKQLDAGYFNEELKDVYEGFITGILAPKYGEFIGEELQKAYMESYGEYGQNVFDRYITYADHWIQDHDYRDPDTGEQFDRATLNSELEKIEKTAGISNPKDFRNEVVNYVLRERANNSGDNPKWTSYEKLRAVIEKKIFSNTEELLPVISFGSKQSKTDEKNHKNFVERMIDNGYTEKQVRLATEWWIRYRKHS